MDQLNHTAGYYAQQQGDSWIIRDNLTGEVMCIRPDRESAERAMISLQKVGQFEEAPNGR